MTAARHRRPWTEADLRLLAWGWGEVTPQVLAERLQRTRVAVYQKGIELGYSDARDESTVSLREAAEQMGFCIDSMKAVLRWAGVKVARRKIGSRREPHPDGRRWLVSIEDVREAVERWLGTVPVAEAAVELGETPSSLRRWLREAGHIEWGAKGCKQRVSLDVCREVLAEVNKRRGRPRLEWFAKQLGASCRRLRRELRRAGHRPVAGHWVVTIEECRAALEGGV